MKTKILLMAFVVIPLCAAFSQNTNVFFDRMNVIFQNVNRTPVTTGLLKDYGLALTDISKYNGTLLTNNAVNRAEWQSIYSSLYFMKFNTNATLLSPGSVNTAITNNKSVVNGHEVNDIIALHFNYEQFKSTALPNNLVYVSNNKIYDVAGRSTSPYEVKTAFVFTPVSGYLIGNNHVFRFSPQLFFKNVAKTISAVQIDFGDNAGFRTVVMGSNIHVTYPNNGDKTIVLKITYTDGSIMQGKSVIKVREASEICTACRYVNPQFEAFPKSAFPVAQGQMGTGNVWIYYGGNDRILDKPLILAEGFDPLNDIGRNALFTEGFLDRDINIDYLGQTLRQALDEHNYDLVFVDYGQGGDAIQRNAYMLENVIQWVNQEKARNGSTEKNIVAGVSMGGLVARYALRDMEIRNQNNTSSPQHDTRLYISFDSPHLGANVPLGFQAAIRYLSGVTVLGVRLVDLAPEIGQGLEALSSPAATQMLYYQLQGTGNVLAVNNAPHSNFLNEITGMGMPQRWGIRNIAVASGSECGIDQGYAPYTQMLVANQAKDLDYLTTLLISMFEPEAAGIFGGLVTTDSDIRFNMEIRALPDRESKRIFHLLLSHRKEILWGAATSTEQWFNFSFNSTADLLPLDNSPGGTFDIRDFGDIPDDLVGVGLSPVEMRFNFIPTPSALNMGSGNQVLANQDLARAYSPALPPTGAKSIPFHNFFSNPLANQNHIQFTTENGRWLFQEIEGTPAYYSCSYACANTEVQPAISGTGTLCSSAQYTVTNNPDNLNLVWSTSNSSQVSIGSSGVASIVKYYKGYINIEVTVNGSCNASPKYTKKIWVGTPELPGAISGQTQLTPGMSASYYIQAPIRANSYKWVIPSGCYGHYCWEKVVENQTMLTVRAGDPGYDGIEYKATNVCGTNTRSIMVNVQNPGSGGGGGGGGDCGPTLMASPNPAKGRDITVSVIYPPDPCEETMSAGDLEETENTFALIDDQGNVQEGKVKGPHIRLDPDKLQKGLYIIQVNHRGMLLQTRLAID